MNGSKTTEEYHAMGLLLGMDYWEQYHAFSPHGIMPRGTIDDMYKRWLDADTLEPITNGLLVRLVRWRRKNGLGELHDDTTENRS